MTAGRRSVPRRELEQCVRALPDAVVLRNGSDIAKNVAAGGDVDVLVGDINLAEWTVREYLGAPLRIIRRSYVTELAFDWGNIDLLPRLEWRGATYLEAGRARRDAVRSDRGWLILRPADEAAVSWLTSLLWGGFFKARYATTIARAAVEDGDALRQALIDAVGKSWGSRLFQSAVEGQAAHSEQWVVPVRRAVWGRAFLQAPITTLTRTIGFVRSEVALRLRPPVPWIAILGCDGSGKSTLLEGLRDRYADCPYAQMTALHWRPRVLARGRGSAPVTEPHAKPSHGPIKSLVSLGVLITDWIVGYWTRLVHLRTKGYLLVFDRVYYDLAVDPRRYRYGGSQLLARAVWAILPRPDLVFLLDVPVDELLRRKQELPADELTRQRESYTRLVGALPSGHVLDGTRPTSDLVDEIDRVVRHWLTTRSIPESQPSGQPRNSLATSHSVER